MTSSNLRGFALYALGMTLGCDGSPLRLSSPKETATPSDTVTGTTTMPTTSIQVSPGDACPEGYSLCKVNGTIRCADLVRSTDDCGQCGNTCAPGIACSAGKCQQYACKGTLTFQALPGIATSNKGSPQYFEDLCVYRPVLEDFNRDGTLDFVGLPGIHAPMGLLFGNGDGTFRGQTIAEAFTGEWRAYAADLNRDGWLDLASTEKNQTKVSVRLGNGDPTTVFAAPRDYDTATPPVSVLLADLDADGNTDLAAGVGSTLQRWHGDEGGAFVPMEALPLGSQAKTLVATDYNGDSLLDLLYGDTTLRMVLGSGPGTVGAPIPCGLALDLSAIRTLNPFIDFDHDGTLDMVTAMNGVMLGMNGCNFSSLVVPPGWVTSYDQSIYAADMNGDGHPDVITRSWKDWDKTTVILGTGKGTFTQGQDFPSYGVQGDNVYLTGDLNKDTKLDLIVFRRDGWQVLLNTCR